ncbi:type VI secretion system baseplate subunit TssF [Ralstonia sp. UBA689]|uniref:type VI secretion system baseplate subunit TssF n=1 Tax=Ralstonia sp. UBA689 TaxID=1947373 RepID=UPI0025F04B24|nr:type VI secretion system baseplate subunit TssF [Ralstonia sp. UBA689]
MLNRYYEEELNKLKGLAVEFSQNNPALAPMLSGASADPDVERLLEGVAFLIGLTRQKLDDEFPEFVQELANLLFPHYLRPVPASTLISFTPKSPLGEVVRVPQGTELASLPVDGTSCRFRTICDLDVQPLRLVDANLLSTAGVAPVLVMDFEVDGLALSQWESDSLRLFLGGGYSEASKMLLLLTRHVTQVRVSSDGGERLELDALSVRASGFDHRLLPYPGNAFDGYRVLQEYFSQPEKFLFVDIEGLGRWTNRGRGSAFSMFFSLDELPDWMPEIRSDRFGLNVVPAINLFEHTAEPVNLDHRASEYRVSPEGRNRTHYRVYSVDQVTGYQQGAARERTYLPFGLYRHDGRSAKLSYRTTLREATVMRGNETFLSVNYPPGDTPVPETLSIRITCTNGSLPESLKLGDISQPTSTSPERIHFQNIRPVTPALESPIGEALLWRLISHVSLNYLSIAQTANLRTLLALYAQVGQQDQGTEAANRRRIDGIQEVIAMPETRLVGRGSVLRGQFVRIRCRQDHYADIGDMYLFGCVLERFLADYASINAYTRVELEDVLSETIFKWPPRLGQQTLL